MNTLQEFEQIWKENAPEELQDFMDLHLSPDLYTKNDLKTKSSLMWALKNLDEEWQARAIELIIAGYGDGTLFKEIKQRRWRNLLRSWPYLSCLWLSQPPENVSSSVVTPQPDNDYFEDLLLYLYQSLYPLGAPKAENDPTLISARYDGLGVYRNLENSASCFVLGEMGVGKTSTALWLCSFGLSETLALEKRFFPVYCQYTFVPSLDQIVSSWAKAILSYIAIIPGSFQRRSVMGRAAIAHLLALSVTSNSELNLMLHEAGLPNTGAGIELKEEIQKFTKDVVFGSHDENRLVSLLGESFPAGFKYTSLILDLNFPKIISRKAKTELLNLVNLLSGIGISIKVFADEAVVGVLGTEYPVYRLAWDKKDLLEMLKNRLAQITPSELGAWCDPAARMTSPEDRIINASNGTPAGVIEKLNRLFKKITLAHPSLSSNDLDEVLGPISARTRRRS